MTKEIVQPSETILRQALEQDEDRRMTIGARTRARDTVIIQALLDFMDRHAHLFTEGVQKPPIEEPENKPEGPHLIGPELGKLRVEWFDEDSIYIEDVANDSLLELRESQVKALARFVIQSMGVNGVFALDTEAAFLMDSSGSGLHLKPKPSEGWSCSVKYDAEAGVFVATSDDTISQGETRAEAVEALEGAVRLKQKYELKQQNQLVDPAGKVWELRWHEGKKQMKRVEHQYWMYYIAPFTTWPDFQKSVDEWFSSNKPLAENQVEERSGRVHDLRWHDGRPEHRTGELWSLWFLGVDSDWCRVGDDWFRKHCPSDRFITDDGRLLGFRMRDDGEAETHDHLPGVRGTLTCTPPYDYAEHEDSRLFHALYRFRDSERAKWGFTLGEDGITVRFPDGHTQKVPGKKKGKRRIPTWVRRKAEALLRIGKTEWRTEWNPHWGGDQVTPRGCVDILLGSRVVGIIKSDGEVLNSEETFPLPTLVEAREKLRKNLKLENDEVWMGEELRKLRFHPEGFQGLAFPLVEVVDTNFQWNEDCVWPPEFSEAAKRVKRFYMKEKARSEQEVKKSVEKMVKKVGDT